MVMVVVVGWGGAEARLQPVSVCCDFVAGLQKAGDSPRQQRSALAPFVRSPAGTARCIMQAMRTQQHVLLQRVVHDPSRLADVGNASADGHAALAPAGAEGNDLRSERATGGPTLLARCPSRQSAEQASLAAGCPALESQAHCTLQAQNRLRAAHTIAHVARARSKAEHAHGRRTRTCSCGPPGRQASCSCRCPRRPRSAVEE